MADITAEKLRSNLLKEIDEAKLKLSVLIGQLEWLEKQMGIVSDYDGQRGLFDTPENESENKSLVAPSKAGGTKIGIAIKEFMLDAPGEFNVPGIVKAMSQKFPDVTKEELSRKASQVASRLAKKEKITKVHEGVGREPNIYRSNKLVSK